MPLLCGYSRDALVYSAVLALYTCASCVTLYGVLPQRILFLTCEELQAHARQQQQQHQESFLISAGTTAAGSSSSSSHSRGLELYSFGMRANATTTPPSPSPSCSSAAVVDAATDRNAYLSIAYALVGVLVSGPITRYAELRRQRRRVLLVVLFGVLLDQSAQIFATSWVGIVVSHSCAALLGNLYIVLALLFSFISDASFEPGASESSTAQRRKNYGLAEGCVYLGVIVGPPLGGLVFRLSKETTSTGLVHPGAAAATRPSDFQTPYFVSASIALVLFVGAYFALPAATPAAAAARARGNREALLLESVVHDDAQVEDEEGAGEEATTAATCASCWWNPLAPFFILFGSKRRVVCALALFSGWLGQKGSTFIFNSFIKIEYNGGPYLGGLIMMTQCVASVLANVLAMRLFAAYRARPSTIVATATCFAVASCVGIGLFARQRRAGAANGDGVGQPSALFWASLCVGGLSAFFSPGMRSCCLRWQPLTAV